MPTVIRFDHQFASDSDRLAFAKVISGVVNAGKWREDPYRPNERDGHEYVVDQGNDWRVIFDREDPYSLRMFHRYSNQDAIKALSNWIAYRYRGIVTELP